MSAILTKEDRLKLYTITRNSVFNEYGLLNDLPYDLANAVANVHWRYFEYAIMSPAPSDTREWEIRTSQFEAIPGAVSAYRKLPGKGLRDADIKAVAFYYVNLLTYRLPDAENKTPLRCMIERRFRKSYDIPDLVKCLLLY
jgi:hypothetical protein